ncbi:1,4-alpha-glucan branching protein GlgB [Hoyosella rhizosphaerae]|nr:1,4-alpha-glucan branching protein GlgB [Hoyosella rhizosphaerae]
MSARERQRLLTGVHSNPHAALGAHRQDGQITIRVLRPYAEAVHLRTAPGIAHEMHAEGDGLFSITLAEPASPDYTIDARYADSNHVTPDGYSLPPSVSDRDLAAFSEGRCAELWKVLGAHHRNFNGVNGVGFTVWAPHAQGVFVTGDFDHWSGRTFPMRLLPGNVWEVFVPGAKPGDLYKFRIHTPSGRIVEKADPMAQATEVPPATASQVCTSAYQWNDTAWMRDRQSEPWTARPVSIYEVHAGSWSGTHSPTTYRELAETLIPYVQERGFTHIEFMPLTGHPYGGSWGYQVTSYYAPTPKYGTPDDFRYLIDTCHQAGIGVILDWVPAHFPRDDWALARFDGLPLYEHPDPQRGEHPDWGTYIFDWGRAEVRNFLTSNALYWLTNFHIDGLRVDAVASMLYLDYSRPPGGWKPNEIGGRENLDAVTFLQELTTAVENHAPGAITIAEDSTTWPGVTRPVRLGGLGFTFKWNMGWMNDVLRYISREPQHRGYHHNEVTFSLMNVASEQFLLPLSHDEVVHGKGTLWSRIPGTSATKASVLRALLASMWAHPGKKLLFMGQEFGQSDEWCEMRGVDWFETNPSTHDGALHNGITRLVDHLNSAYRSEAALWQSDGQPETFTWIDASDTHNSVVSFLRHHRGSPSIACVVNFSSTALHDYRLGLPQLGTWTEIVNTDAEEYGGHGIGNFGAVLATDEPWHGHRASAVITIPAASALWLRAPQAQSTLG